MRVNGAAIAAPYLLAQIHSFAAITTAAGPNLICFFFLIAFAFFTMRIVLCAIALDIAAFVFWSGSSFIIAAIMAPRSTVACSSLAKDCSSCCSSHISSASCFMLSPSSCTPRFCLDSIWNQLRSSLHNYLDFVIFIGFVELSNKNLEIVPKSVGKI